MKTKPTIKLVIALTLVCNATIYTIFYYFILNSSPVFIKAPAIAQIKKKILPERIFYINDLSSINELRVGVISTVFPKDLSKPVDQGQLNF